MNVLAIKDSWLTFKVLEMAICEHGHQVLPVSDNAEALKTIETENIDLIVSVLRNENTSGIELGINLREQGKELPIIYLSFLTTLEVLEESKFKSLKRINIISGSNHYFKLGQLLSSQQHNLLQNDTNYIYSSSVANIFREEDELHFQFTDRIHQNEVPDLEKIVLQMKLIEGIRNFIFDFTEITDIAVQNWIVLYKLQTEIRGKGNVYVALPDKNLREKMIRFGVFNLQEIYSSTASLKLALKECASA